MTETVRIVVDPSQEPSVGALRDALFTVAAGHRCGAQVMLRVLDVVSPPIQLGEARMLDALAWLGLRPSEKPCLHQSERLWLYHHVLVALVKANKTYPCFCSAGELGGPKTYGRRCFFLSQDEVRQRLAANVPHCVRLIAPNEGEAAFCDAVRGVVRGPLDDLVLLDARETPSTVFAAACDDYEDRITQVVQGEERPEDALAQVQTCHALGWTPPCFAHLPALRGEDGATLQKGSSATLVDTYRKADTPPEALLCYLASPTFGFPDGRQMFSLGEMARDFDFALVGKGPCPQLTAARLAWLSEQRW